MKAQYESIASDPNLKGIKYKRMVEVFVNEFLISESHVKQIMRLMVLWTLDNRENIKQMVEDGEKG